MAKEGACRSGPPVTALRLQGWTRPFTAPRAGPQTGRSALDNPEGPLNRSQWAQKYVALIKSKLEDRTRTGPNNTQCPSVNKLVSIFIIVTARVLSVTAGLSTVPGVLLLQGSQQPWLCSYTWGTRGRQKLGHGPASHGWSAEEPAFELSLVPDPTLSVPDPTLSVPDPTLSVPDPTLAVPGWCHNNTCA